jgi:dephospho-CoA kinase
MRFSVGLTGGIGSGKTTVALMFQELGAELIDTDEIAHALTKPNGGAIAAIAQQFGDDFILPSGALNREKMRDLVFAEATQKTKLEMILHPMIRAEAEHQAANANGIYSIFVVPLLVESGKWRQRVTRILVIDCPEETQITRVRQRNSLSRDQVQAIMQNQVTRTQRLDAADDVILNDGPIDSIRHQVETLHHVYCELSKK